MNAIPLLATLLEAMREERLEAVLIGNAAAAMHGAPVTTLDFDFMFRDTPMNMKKLKRVAVQLDAVILRPFYPVSKLYRLTTDALGLQADFMPVIHGIRSFAGLKTRAIEREVAGIPVLVACLDDIIASKKAATAILPSCRFSNEPGGNSAAGRTDRQRGERMAARKRPQPRRQPASRRTRLDALARESERQLDELIRRRLAMPLEQRMDFLRRRLPGGGSCL